MLNAQYGSKIGGTKNLKFEVYQTPHLNFTIIPKNDSLIKNFIKANEAWYALHQQVLRDAFRPNPVILSAV
jgi:hypothetical protein